MVLQVGGGSKIKSAVSVCSLDRGGHVLLELVSNSDWDLLGARTDALQDRGGFGLRVGFYLRSDQFYRLL